MLELDPSNECVLAVQVQGRCAPDEMGPHSGSWGNGAASENGGKAAYAGIDAAGTPRASSLGARDHFEVAGRHGSVRGLSPWLLGIWA